MVIGISIPIGIIAYLVNWFVRRKPKRDALKAFKQDLSLFLSNFLLKAVLIIFVFIFLALVYDSEPGDLFIILLALAFILFYVVITYPLMHLSRVDGLRFIWAWIPLLNLILVFQLISSRKKFLSVFIPILQISLICIPILLNVLFGNGLNIFLFLLYVILPFVLLMLMMIPLWKDTFDDVKRRNMKFSIVFKQNLFDAFLSGSGMILVVVLLGIFISLIINAMPSIEKFGFKFFIGTEWLPDSENPENSVLGALPFLIGTLITSFLALLISLPFALSIAILLGEYFKRGFIYSLFKTITELLAGIPSIIYGFFGFFIAKPILLEVEKFFGVELANGLGIFTSSIILAIMIIPYSASLARDVIELVPQDLKEAGYSLGATRFEVIRKIIIPYARSGIFAGIILSLGRALGETMAVTMLIGNRNEIPTSIFDPANTMASIIANGFAEAGGLQSAALIEMGLMLMFITAVINIIGRLIIKKFSVEG